VPAHHFDPCFVEVGHRASPYAKAFVFLSN